MKSTNKTCSEPSPKMTNDLVSHINWSPLSCCPYWEHNRETSILQTLSSPFLVSPTKKHISIFNTGSISIKCFCSPLQYPRGAHRLVHRVSWPWRCHTWRWQSCPHQSQPRGRGHSWCCLAWWSRWGQWEASLCWYCCLGSQRFVKIYQHPLTWR